MIEHNYFRPPHSAIYQSVIVLRSVLDTHLGVGIKVKAYEGADVRNVALIGHGHSGKTTLTAGLLYTAGATNRLTRVDEGNTVTDFDEDEIQRKITISTAVAIAEWK